MKISVSATDQAALKDAATKIEFAGKDLATVEASVNEVFGLKNKLEADLNQSWLNFNPIDRAQLSARAALVAELGVVNGYLNNPPPLIRAFDNLRHAVSAAVTPIKNSAQPRSVAENTISQCFWIGRLASLGMPSPLSNRIYNLHSIAGEVLRDIQVLLSRRIGATLTSDELRAGIFQLGHDRGYRSLTPEERVAGVAHE